MCGFSIPCCPPGTIQCLYVSVVSLFILSHVSNPHTLPWNIPTRRGWTRQTLPQCVAMTRTDNWPLVYTHTQPTEGKTEGWRVGQRVFLKKKEIKSRNECVMERGQQSCVSVRSAHPGDPWPDPSAWLANRWLLEACLIWPQRKFW